MIAARLALPLLLVLASSSAGALEPQKTVMVNTTTGAVVEKEAAPLKGFMQRLLGRNVPPPKAAAKAPIAIAPTDVVAAVAAAAPRKLTAAAAIPLPRLSPTDAADVAAAAPVSPPQGAVALAPQVTYETTGAIAQEPPPDAVAADAAVTDAASHDVAADTTTTAAPAEKTASADAEPPAAGSTATASQAAEGAPPAEVATAASGPRVVGPTPPPVAASVAPPPASPAPAQAVADDSLLGDPSDYYPHGPDEMAPSAIGAEAIAALPSRGPARAKQAKSAVPLGAPFELVRTLQSLQDEVAQGSVSAVGAQRALLVEIDRSFDAAAPSVWQDRRNAEAAVIYVLSGGNPEILARLATMDPKPAVDPKLLAGVFAYATGKEADATANLADLNPVDLPASMAAQVALTQSALAVRTDPKKAMDLLSVARLLGTGTLVEEAAIRREIFVADQMKDAAMVQSLARQYLDRFRHSIYAGNFRIRFAAALSHMAFLDKEDQFPRLDDMLAQVEPESRRQLYLTVSISSLLSSQFVAARLSAERALSLSEPSSPEEARARLYRAAALVPDPKGFDEAGKNIAACDRKLLPATDQALYDMVTVTLAGVASGTDRNAMPKSAPEVAADGTADLAAKPDDPLLARADEALKAVDDMLKVAMK